MSVRDDSNNEVESIYANNEFSNGQYKYSRTFNNLSNDKDYTLYPKVKVFGVEMLASPSSKMEETDFPVEIIEFKQTGSTYSKEGFNYQGSSYQYKYDCAVTVELKSPDNIDDWGYVYETPNGTKTHISLKSFTSPYIDSRYSYYRDKRKDHITLYEYVKFKDKSGILYGESKDYELKCNDGPIKVVTLGSSHIKTTREYLEGQVEDYDKSMQILFASFVASTNDDELSDNIRVLSSYVDNSGHFICEAYGLNPNTTYAYQAYIRVKDSDTGETTDYYGENMLFTTKDHPEEYKALLDRYMAEEADYSTRASEAYALNSTNRSNYISSSVQLEYYASIYKNKLYMEKAESLLELANTCQKRAKEIAIIMEEIELLKQKLDYDAGEAGGLFYEEDDYDSLVQYYNEFCANGKSQVETREKEAAEFMRQWKNIDAIVRQEGLMLSNL